MGPLQDGDNKTVTKIENHNKKKLKKILIIAPFDFFCSTVTKLVTFRYKKAAVCHFPKALSRVSIQ